MSENLFYLCAGPEQYGALGIYHAYGVEEELASSLDGRLGRRSGLDEKPAVDMAMRPGELRYGWLWDLGGVMLDEVMLGCPAAGMRVLMTHGGGAVRAAVTGYFENSGFSRMADDLSDGAGVEVDGVLDVVLASCLTEAQAAAVLGWRLWGEPVRVGLLGVHRVVLAGAANAGKSSLLNCLCGYDRAFVDARAGATRDVVDELADVGGYALWLGDMPGYMGEDQGVGELERASWRRAEERLRLSEWVWLVIDGGARWEGESANAAKRIAGALDENKRNDVLIVVNKSDLAQGFCDSPWRSYFPDATEVRVSSLPGGNARVALGEAVRRHFSVKGKEFAFGNTMKYTSGKEML